MAMTNAERQRRWVEKHRALHNLRRRGSRNKKKIATTEMILKALSELREQILSGGVEAADTHSRRSELPGVAEPDQSTITDAVVGLNPTPGLAGSSAPPAQLPDVTVTAGKFKKMISLSSFAPIVDDEPPPMIYKNDRGQVVPKWQWEKWQEDKRKAKRDGYEIDQYSQL